MSPGHDGHGRDVSDGPNGGGTHPWRSGETTSNVYHTEDDDVQVETGTLLQFPVFLIDNQFSDMGLHEE